MPARCRDCPKWLRWQVRGTTYMVCYSIYSTYWSWAPSYTNALCLVQMLRQIEGKCFHEEFAQSIANPSCVKEDPCNEEVSVAKEPEALRDGHQPNKKPGRGNGESVEKVCVARLWNEDLSASSIESMLLEANSDTEAHILKSLYRPAKCWPGLHPRSHAMTSRCLLRNHKRQNLTSEW